MFFEVDLANVTSNTNTAASRKTSMKRLHDLQRQITCITLMKEFLLIGTPQSQVVVYDFNLKLIKQFASLSIGPLRSIGASENTEEKEKADQAVQGQWTQASNHPEAAFQLHEAICQSDQVSVRLTIRFSDDHPFR